MPSSVSNKKTSADAKRPAAKTKRAKTLHDLVIAAAKDADVEAAMLAVLERHPVSKPTCTNFQMYQQRMTGKSKKEVRDAWGEESDKIKASYKKLADERNCNLRDELHTWNKAASVEARELYAKFEQEVKSNKSIKRKRAGGKTKDTPGKKRKTAETADDDGELAPKVLDGDLTEDDEEEEEDVEDDGDDAVDRSDSKRTSRKDEKQQATAEKDASKGDTQRVDPGAARKLRDADQKLKAAAVASAAVTAAVNRDLSRDPLSSEPGVTIVNVFLSRLMSDPRVTADMDLGYVDRQTLTEVTAYAGEYCFGKQHIPRSMRMHTAPPSSAAADQHSKQSAKGPGKEDVKKATAVTASTRAADPKSSSSSSTTETPERKKKRDPDLTTGKADPKQQQPAPPPSKKDNGNKTNKVEPGSSYPLPSTAGPADRNTLGTSSEDKKKKQLASGTAATAATATSPGDSKEATAASNAKENGDTKKTNVEDKVSTEATLAVADAHARKTNGIGYETPPAQNKTGDDDDDDESGLTTRRSVAADDDDCNF